MPITILDPNTALVIIDLQQGIIALPVAHPVAPIVAHAAKLAQAFRRRNSPVVLVNVAGGASGRADVKQPPFNPPAAWTELVPELDRQPSDILITKLTWGAFTGTALDMQLRRRGVTQIVLCGVATSVGVESTARFAHELGYNLTIITDAMTDMKLDAHNNSLTNIFPRIAETGTTAELLAQLG